MSWGILRKKWMGFFFAHIAFSSLAASELQMNLGTLSVGGMAAVGLEWTKDPASFKAKIELNPQIGVFLCEGLELLGEIKLAKTFYASAPERQKIGPIGWGAGVGARYFFNTGTVVYPYLGALISFYAIGKPTLDTIKGELKVPLGILVALNEHVGLNIGIPVTMHWGLRSRGFNRFEVPIGYFGVIAFF